MSGRAGGWGSPLVPAAPPAPPHPEGRHCAWWRQLGTVPPLPSLPLWLLSHAHTVGQVGGRAGEGGGQPLTPPVLAMPLRGSPLGTIQGGAPCALLTWEAVSPLAEAGWPPARSAQRSSWTVDAMGVLPVTPAIRYGGQGQEQDPEHTNLTALRQSPQAPASVSLHTSWVGQLFPEPAARPAPHAPWAGASGPKRDPQTDTPSTTCWEPVCTSVLGLP